MSGNLRRDLLNAVRPVASANGTVSAVVQRLAAQAETVTDPETRAKILEAAQELLGAAEDINRALAKVAETR